MVEPGDSRAIAAHMEECFRDRDLLQYMSGNARRTAVKATWDRYAAGVAEALTGN